jgi:hypothetical protein
MERRQVITSLCALLGLGGRAGAAAQPKPKISKNRISKNSTPCAVSEQARAARPTRGPSIESKQNSTSPQGSPR